MLQNLFLRLAAAAAFAVVPAGPLAIGFLATGCASSGLLAQSVQLADGRVLLANVEQADGEGLRVHRLDNGGMLDLRWDQLSAASAFAIKRQFDLVSDSQDELLVRADEVEFLVNGGKQTLIGRIVERGADPLVVQIKGVPYRVPRSELRGVRSVEVPVTQIFTMDEFYASRKAELQPLATADQHVLLAEDLVKVRDYDRATEHLEKAKEIGDSRNAQHLEAMLVRLQRYQEAANERRLLDQIQAARSRGQMGDFEKGGKLIAQFEKEFPQSKLKAEFDLEKKRFGESRTRFLSQKVADQWRQSIKIVVDKKVADDSVGLQVARDYAENKLTDDIVERLVGVLKLEAAEIKQFWGERDKYPVGKRTEHFNYGIGSWILGDKGILKDTAAGKAQEKQQPAREEGNDRDVERLAKLFRQAMERRRAAVQGPGANQQEQTDEDWWRQASRDERTNWLRAYYAEFGGQLVLTYATASPCVSCYGQGSTPEVGGDGKLVQTKCFLCQGTKWLRSFKAY